MKIVTAIKLIASSTMLSATSAAYSQSLGEEQPSTAVSLRGYATIEEETFYENSDDSNEFQPPDELVARSPCPAINTLANHGFINRNGKDVDVDDLSQALEHVYRVSSEILRNGPVQSAIGLGLTVTNSAGDTTLSIDRLFQSALFHDSSFVREDPGQTGVDDRRPSPRLIHSFFNSENQVALAPGEVLAFQRERIRDSCTRRKNEGSSREYTAAQRGGMAIQGVLLFILAGQSRQDPLLAELNKANLRSFLEFERLPDDFDRLANRFFAFGTGSFEQQGLVRFRANVEEAICSFCPDSQCVSSYTTSLW